MNPRIPILIVIAAGACALPETAGAQSRRLPDASKTVAPKVATPKAATPKADQAKATEKHVASLLQIAQELRESGQTDVAQQIEAQARRLMGPPRPREKAPEPEPVRGRARAWIVRDGKARPVPRAGRVVGAPPARVWYARPSAGSKPPTPTPLARGKARAPGLPGVWRPVQQDPMVTPKTAGDDFVVIPKDRAPDANDARISVGRNRFRYSPVPTARDSRGRVIWRGLPAPKRATASTTKYYGAIAASDHQLRERVQALSREVRAMRRTLDKLSKDLKKERRKRLIR